jgi:hypothetical protein
MVLFGYKIVNILLNVITNNVNKNKARFSRIEGELYIHSFLSLLLVEDEWPTAHLDRFTPELPTVAFEPERILAGSHLACFGKRRHFIFPTGFRTLDLLIRSPFTKLTTLTR